MWDDFDTWIRSLLGDEETRDWDWNDILYEITDENEFERLVAELWEDLGFETEWTGAGRDGGIDVRATNSGMLGWGGVEVVIEVKWYKDGNSVSAPRVQKLEGARSAEDADRAVLVTSSTFAKPARAYANKLDHLELINGRDLIDYLNESSVEPPQVEYHS